MDFLNLTGEKFMIIFFKFYVELISIKLKLTKGIPNAFI
ncbi:MAG: hypothetical protein IGBAC_1032 [Ignavibacteriae bacterium]|nr:MAG: hypothetical protein IGBAC_1032 [Ignavibacteriota bacterium]